MKRLHALHILMWVGVMTVVSWILPQGVGITDQASAQDSYTQVSVSAKLPYAIPGGGAFTIDGPTTFSFTGTHVPGFSTPAQAIGDGFASFTSLHAKIDLSGPAAFNANTIASSSEVHTPSGGTPGAADMMSLAYSLDGFATIDVNRTDILPGVTSIAGARITAYKLVSGQSSLLLGSETIDLSSYTPVAGQFGYGNTPPQSLALIDVPFVYGETFSLLVQFMVFAEVDNDLINVTSNPYFENWGGGVIDRVVVDYSNTAELIAIVNQNNPGMILVGQSGTDYTPLVTDTFPTLALPGDLNGDGFVGIDDLNIVLINWNQSVTPGDLLAGDPTGEGFVGLDDLNVVLVNWNNGTPPGEGAAIPEPGTAAGLAVGSLAFLCRRRAKSM